MIGVTIRVRRRRLGVVRGVSRPATVAAGLVGRVLVKTRRGARRGLPATAL